MADGQHILQTPQHTPLFRVSATVDQNGPLTDQQGVHITNKSMQSSHPQMLDETPIEVGQNHPGMGPSATRLTLPHAKLHPSSHFSSNPVATVLAKT